jgi:hypothetical protein
LPYLQYRAARLSKDSAPPILKVVLETAEALCARTDYALEDFDRVRKCVEALCELVFSACYYVHFSHDEPHARDHDMLDKHLLVAAAYLDQQELVQELAADVFKGNAFGFALQSSVLGSPITAAARNGHAQVLEILFQSMPEDTPKDLKRRVKYYAVSQTALHGHMKAFSMFLNDRWVGWESPHTSLPGRGASHPIYMVPLTPNKQIHLRWKAFLLKNPFSLFKSRPMFGTDHILLYHLRNGNAEMFEYFCKINFAKDFMPHKIDPPETQSSKVVELVCQLSSPIFKLISKDVASWPQNLATVCHAANGGQFETVRTLIENGQFIDAVPRKTGIKPAVVAAFVNEDVKMFEYLLEHGATFDTVNTLTMAIRMAKAEGLDSMLDLLSKRGIPIEHHIPWPKPKQRRCKQCHNRDKQEKDDQDD